MKKKHIIFFFLCAAIFASGVLGCIGVLNRPHGTMVEIVRDNEVLYQFDLVQAEDQMMHGLAQSIALTLPPMSILYFRPENIRAKPKRASLYKGADNSGKRRPIPAQAMIDRAYKQEARTKQSADKQ